MGCRPALHVIPVKLKTDHPIPHNHRSEMVNRTDKPNNEMSSDSGDIPTSVKASRRGGALHTFPVSARSLPLTTVKSQTIRKTKKLNWTLPPGVFSPLSRQAEKEVPCPHSLSSPEDCPQEGSGEMTQGSPARTSSQSVSDSRHQT
jgi:hypothetical protein